MTPRHLAVLLALIATSAIAHDNVKDPSVKARMDMMKEIKAATGVLGNMAKQPATYNKAQADAAKATLASLAGKIPAAFQDQARDPVSEASPGIWQNWADFTARATDLKAAAQAMDSGSAGGVARGMQDIGAACGSCHKAYRL